MLEEYKKVKHLFKRPKLHCYFGFWGTPDFIVKIGKYLMDNQGKKSTFKYKVYYWLDCKFWKTNPCLPIWRRGNTIRLFKRQQVYDYQKAGGYVWSSDFEKTLKKLHLSWLKPSYELPIWLSFYFFNWDICWKWKYDDVRYEFPPQLTIVLFNVSLSLYWKQPKSKLGYDEMYWESILNYNYKYKDTLHGKNVDELSQIIGLSDYCGYWMHFNSDNTYSYTWSLRPEYLRNKEYAKILQEHQDMKTEALNNRDVLLKCPKCGKRMHLVDKNITLTTDPPQYEYECCCGEHKYLTEKIDF